MTRAERIATAAALYADGLSLADVGARLGVHLTTVHGWLVASGVARRPRGSSAAPRVGRRPHDAATRERAVRLVVHSRLSHATVAARFGVSSWTVGRWVRLAAVVAVTTDFVEIAS